MDFLVNLQLYARNRFNVRSRLRKQRDCSLDLVASNSKPRRPKLFEQVLQFRVLDCDVDAQELGLIVGKTRVPKR